MNVLLNTKDQTIPPLMTLKTPSNDYVSIFNIDGQPILPPLMTIEKRYEMQMYREKAMELERKFQVQQPERRVKFSDIQLADPFNLESSYSESVSQLSSEILEGGQSGSENLCSYRSQKEQKILSPKSFKHSSCNTDNPAWETKKSVDCSTNTSDTTMENNLSERMQKLRKSETVVFDNTLNTIIKAMTDLEVAQANEEQEIEHKKQIQESGVKEKADLNRPESKKCLQLPLQQRIINYHKIVPSISVNPPTPLAGPNSICDTLSGSESAESFDPSGFQSNQTTHDQTEAADESTDDSCNISKTDYSLIAPQKEINGITARVLHYEQKNLDAIQNRTECEENSIELIENYYVLRPPQRSATSPSLKSLSDTLGTTSLTPSPRLEDSSINSLVRSSSFTLDSPSKALIDHILQQRDPSALKDSDNLGKSQTPPQQSLNTRRTTPSPSAWRDTVESKAKRVQKKHESKPGTRPTSTARSKSKTFNNYSSASQVWNSPLPPPKSKRSPYDLKTAGQLTKPSGKNCIIQKNSTSSKLLKSNSVKKSASSTTYTINQAASRHSLPNNGNSHGCGNESMNEIDNRHRQKLILLLAQQQEEQRRLQLVFETQQKMLLEQLNSEKCNGQVDGRQSLPGCGNFKTTFQLDGYCGNLTNAYNGNSLAATLERVSPTSLSVTSSYVAPNLGGIIGGFTTTTTLAPCDLPLDVSSVCSSTGPHNELSSPQRRSQIVGLPSAAYSESVVHGIDKAETSAVGDCLNSTGGRCSRFSNQPDLEQRGAAATVINAYARGFLVRRMFQTEQIQRIVQTIRDTLIFVLNLHMETMQNPEEANTAANIKFKAQLLQQLVSASRTLHLIFFQTSVKERMEIISRDRKRIKTKLLAMNLRRSKNYNGLTS